MLTADPYNAFDPLILLCPIKVKFWCERESRTIGISAIEKLSKLGCPRHPYDLNGTLDFLTHYKDITRVSNKGVHSRSSTTMLCRRLNMKQIRLVHAENDVCDVKKKVLRLIRSCRIFCERIAQCVAECAICLN